MVWHNHMTDIAHNGVADKSARTALISMISDLLHRFVLCRVTLPVNLVDHRQHIDKPDRAGGTRGDRSFGAILGHCVRCGYHPNRHTDIGLRYFTLDGENERIILGCVGTGVLRSLSKIIGHPTALLPAP